MASEQQKADGELRYFRRQGVSQAEERERLLAQMRLMEEENERQMQELVAKHEEQMRQVGALAALHEYRDTPQQIERDQSRLQEQTRVQEPRDADRHQLGLVADDGVSENWETISQTSSRGSVFRPGQYRVPETLNRTDPVQIEVQIGDSQVQDTDRVRQAAWKNAKVLRNEERKGQQQESLDKDEEIRTLERKLYLLRQQRAYPIDAQIEVIEPDNDRKGRAPQRKPSFLSDSFEGSNDITQQNADQKPVVKQSFEDHPPVREDRFKDDRRLSQYEGDERTSSHDYMNRKERKHELQQNEISTGISAPIQTRDVRPKERQYHYTPPPIESTVNTKRMQFCRQQEVEQRDQRTVSHDRFEQNINENSQFVQMRRVEDNLRAWEEELRRKETELIEREERLAFQERRRQEACQLREKEQELRRRMELLQIREHKLAQGEARMRNEIYEAEQSPVKKEASQEKNYPSAVISNREAVTEEKSEFKQHSTNEEHPLDLSQKRTYQREENFNREIKREAVQHTTIKPEVEQYPLAEEVSKRYVQGDIKSNRGPTADTVNRKEIAYTEIQTPARVPEQHTVVEIQDTNKGSEIRKVLDIQYSFPKFSPFSGEDPKPKAEASFEEWRYEVNCARESGDYSASMIAQAIRKSLRNPAKKLLLPLGTSASVEIMMDKLNNSYDNVAKGQSILRNSTLQHSLKRKQLLHGAFVWKKYFRKL